MASTQFVTNLLLWERVVVMMRLSPGASCSWNPKVPKPGIPHMVLPKSAPAPNWADAQDYGGLRSADANWLSYLIVVERLVDDTCDGFASMSNTNEDSHIVQEAWQLKTVVSNHLNSFTTIVSGVADNMQQSRCVCWREKELRLPAEAFIQRNVRKGWALSERSCGVWTREGSWRSLDAEISWRGWNRFTEKERWDWKTEGNQTKRQA